MTLPADLAELRTITDRLDEIAAGFRECIPDSHGRDDPMYLAYGSVNGAKSCLIMAMNLAREAMQETLKGEG